MDRKAIIVVSASIGFILLWSMVIVPNYLTKPLPPGATNSVTTTAAPASSNRTGDVATVPAATSESALVTADGSQQPFIAPSGEEETLTVTTGEASYVFTSHGGGLKRIELARYPEMVANGREGDTNRVATLNTRAPVPVLAILGDNSVQGDGVYELTRTKTGVRAVKDLPSGLTIIKEFQSASNYLFSATVRFENHSDSALAVSPQEWVVGTATPMNAMDQQADATVGMMWSDGQKTHETAKSWFDNRFLGCFPGTPRSEYRGGSNNVVWVGVHNQFFALVAIPPTNTPSVVARTVSLPKPAASELPEGSNVPVTPTGIQAAINFPGLSLAAGESFEQILTFYAGPKEYRRLAAIAAEQGNNLDGLMSFGFFGFVSKALLLGMNWLHDIAKLPYGWAIVAITFIIKMVFWPLTAASTRSMKRMAALQPQMKALQEKYKDDPAKMNRKLMEFMREQKVSPLGGCLPMLLQIPVFFGFFMMIRSAIELRGAHFLWVMDLSQPDTLFYVAGFPLNLLPLLMGATMFWQAQLTPLSPSMDPTQQKIMKYMPLMFMVFLYNYSAALTLYWTTQNLLTILQTKLTKTKDAPASAAAVPSAPSRKRK